MLNLINFFITPFLRHKVTLTMSSGKNIVFTCKKWNIKNNTALLELSCEGARGFPDFIKRQDVVCMQSKRIFSL